MTTAQQSRIRFGLRSAMLLVLFAAFLAGLLRQHYRIGGLTAQLQRLPANQTSPLTTIKGVSYIEAVTMKDTGATVSIHAVTVLVTAITR